MCACVCVYIYICACGCVCVYVHVVVCVYIYVHVGVCVCICVVHIVLFIVTHSLSAGRHVYYLGVNTVGILALIDASECPPTFGSS